MVAGVGVALLVAYRVGRDRHYVGQLPGLVPGIGERAVEARKPLLHPPPVSVEFGPPDKIRPGQVGTLIDERANVVDVTATIIDFAVRKLIHIKELVDADGRTGQDWSLTKLKDGHPSFLAYESRLFEALFADRDTVRLSELKNTFAADLQKVQAALYADMVGQGWYRQSPATTRLYARAVAALILFVSLGTTAVLALTVGGGISGSVWWPPRSCCSSSLARSRPAPARAARLWPGSRDSGCTSRRPRSSR